MRYPKQVRVNETAGGGRREGGFAVVIVLLSLIGLTALATAGFLLAGSDYDVTQNHRASVRAFYTADEGLRQFIGTQKGVPNDTTVYTFADGTAEVITTLINQPDTLKRLFLITSRSQHTPPEGGMATRTLGTLAIMELSTFLPKAALTSGVGVLKNGSSGTISGFDGSAPGDCAVGGQPPLPGVAVPPGMYQQNGGKKVVPTGNPPIYEGDPLVYLNQMDLDWAGIVAGTALAPDYMIPGDSWPNFSQLAPTDWPIIYHTDPVLSVSPGESGRGTLITRYDLAMNGSFSWDGIVLVGGLITSNGNQSIKGAAVTGLNILLGENPGATDLGNGVKIFRYNSCNIYAAMNQLANLVEEPGTWFDRF